MAMFQHFPQCLLLFVVIIQLVHSKDIGLPFALVEAVHEVLGEVARSERVSITDMVMHLMAANLATNGSTYLCENFFSSMNYRKDKYSSRINDENLNACLRINSARELQPNYEEIMSNSQFSVSK